MHRISFENHNMVLMDAMKFAAVFEMLNMANTVE